MRRVRLPWLFWLGLVLYVVITILVAAGVLNGLDRAVQRACTHHRQDTIAAAARHFTNVFSGATDVACLGVGAGALAWWRRRPAIFVFAALAAGGMSGIVGVTKAAVTRPLPSAVYTTHQGGVYPSGHTAAFLVCFGTLALLATTRHRRLRTPLLVTAVAGAVLVAAAMVYDSFHWLTDCIGSFALGTALLALVQAGVSRRRASPSPRAETPPSDRTARRR